jgi:hypothetical protein
MPYPDEIPDPPLWWGWYLILMIVYVILALR